jgi:hypothetical protein
MYNEKAFPGVTLWLMRKSILYLSCLLLLAITELSCNNDDGDELFELKFPPPPIEFTIQPGLGTFDTHVYTQSPINSQYLSRLTASGHTEEEVDLIQAKDGYLSSLFEDQNLDFIHRVSIYIFDPFEPSNKIEFLYLDPIPYKEKTSIRLFPGITDVSDWIKSGYFGVEIRLDFREISPTLMDMKLEFDLAAIDQ